MKKKGIFLLQLLSLFLLLGLLKARAQAPIFDIKFSEPLAVFEFVNDLSSNASKNSFKTIFDTSKYNQQKYKTLIAAYDSLQIEYSYEYTTYPFGQKIGGSTLSLLTKNLVSCKDIDDFKLNSIGIIPNKDLLELSFILKEFLPVYQELIYNPNKAVFEKQLSELKKAVLSKNISAYFKMGLTFYNSSWDNTIPFEIAFFPLPNSKRLTASAFYNNAISALPTSQYDYNVLLSVMMHEIFHILYDEQSLSFKKNIQEWINNNPSKNSRYAFLLMNEALATTLGNGYVFGEMIGKEDTGQWYNRKYTNLMAKAIYPMVKEYILENKPMDKAFIDNYINIYDEQFAGWLTETDNVMTDRYIISDSMADLHVFNKNFPYRSYSSFDDEITVNSLDKMKQTPITKIVIISKDNKNKLAIIKQTFNTLKDWMPDDKTDFTYISFLEDKTYLIIINNVTKTTTQQIQSLKLE